MENQKVRETSYTLTSEIPYYNGASVDHNSSNVNKVADKFGTATLDHSSK